MALARAGHWAWDVAASLPLVRRCVPKRHIPRRVVVIGGGGAGKRGDTGAPLAFPSNNISTTKYTWWNFLFLNFWHQLHRPANVYFIIIAILTLTPLSPLSPGPGVATILVVLGASALREAFEDIRRWRADVRDNNRKYYVYPGAAGAASVGLFGRLLRRARAVIGDRGWAKERSSAIRVGDIVFVERGRTFPADLLLLAAESESGVATPHCYVETANLDGERNLKLRTTVHFDANDSEDTGGKEGPVSNALSAAIARVSGEVECDEPNAKLYSLTGTFRGHIGGVAEPVERAVDETNLLLRGSKLKNTHAIAGLVLYTGKESKFMLNTTSPPRKSSNIERLMNKYIFLVLLCQLSFILISAGFGVYWEWVVALDHWYLEIERGSFIWLLVTRLVQFLLLYNAFIPISLYVTLEFIRVMQGFFLEWDESMHYKPTDTYCGVRSSGLNEELGQVQYIFSDKTGTLTQNKMEFRMCTVQGSRYGNICYREQDESEPAFQSSELLEAVAGGDLDRASGLDFPNRAAHSFLLTLALCHTVIPVRKPDGTINYESQSPDETALVEACAKLGYVFESRDTPGWCGIRIGGATIEYRVRNVCAFSSDRGRMSVVVEDREGNLNLLIKGADSKLLPLARSDHEYKGITKQHLDEMARAGLRTLAVGYRNLPLEEYEEWNERFEQAKVLGKDRKKALAALAGEIEKDLEILGGTGIEDKLQEGVPDALRMLLAAGIKVWVLTGDKLETAENIANATNLFNSDMHKIVIDVEEGSAVAAKIRENLAALPEELKKGSKKKKKKKSKDNKDEEDKARLGLLITGGALEHALSKENRKEFYELASQCDSVVCCRASPLQKSQVVDVVHKYEGNPISLAIGDGANDISMIQRARIGVGINGEEGMQAVRASDFSIAQFRFLVPLLLVHGRWMYKRIAFVMCFFFYKNCIISTVQFLYNIWSGFSAQTYHDAYFRRGFNLIFTAFPIMLYAIFDEDLQRRSLLAHPRLYGETQSNDSFRFWRFVKWMAFGFYDAVIMFFFIAFIIFGEGQAVESSGRNMSLWESSTTLYTCILLVVNLRLAIHSKVWNVFTWVVWLGSLIIWFPAIAIYCSPLAILLREAQMVGVVYRLFGSPIYWLTVLFTASVCVLPDIILRYLRREFRPTNFHIVQEMELSQKPLRGILYFY